MHSQEKNVASDGTPRININQDDLQALYDELQAAGINDLWTSYIIAYRIGGQAPANAGSPLATLMAAAANVSTQDGMLGAQLSMMGGQNQQRSGGGFGGNSGGFGSNQTLSQNTNNNSSSGNSQLLSAANPGSSQSQNQSNNNNNRTTTNQSSGNNQGNNGSFSQGNNGQNAGNQQKQLWTASVLDSIDLSTATGSVKFNQILDLVDSTVTIGGQQVDSRIINKANRADNRVINRTRAAMDNKAGCMLLR